MKIPCKKLKEFIQDESKGSLEYKKFGLNRLSKDERKHKLYLMRIIKKQCSKQLKGGQMAKKNKLKLLTLWLVIIGGLNWGGTALGFNVVDLIANAINLVWVGTGVYALVGLSAIYQVYLQLK